MLSLLITVALLLIASSAIAQNIQMHYDFGHQNDDLRDRAKWTSTVEMFHPDKYGSTFFFIDFNYQDGKVQSAYGEISRELKFWKAPLSLHLEYNGGLANAFSFNSAYLLGTQYAWNAPDYHAGFTLTPSYKYLQDQEHHHSAQFTATWYYHFARGMFTFSGFADVWGEPDNSKKEKCVFISEPQIWFNLDKVPGVSKDFHLSIGSESELSYNFNPQKKKFYCLPTLALKWTFK